MMKYESLLDEYGALEVSEISMPFEGLYYDGKVWIKKDLSSNKKACILAEEIGHHETTVGNILDQSQIGNMKQEYIARKWAYKKLLPLSSIRKAVSFGHTEIYSMAEYLGVCEEFLADCIKYYIDIGEL